MGRPAEWCMTPCPVCGVMFSDRQPLVGAETELSIHIIQAHGVVRSWAGCFCGWGSKQYGGRVRVHIMHHGGYEAHYQDFLMGVSKENQ